MSHFTVGVILKVDGNESEEMLEQKLLDALLPYQENNMGDVEKEYLEFVSVHDEYEDYYKEYENFSNIYRTFDDYMESCGFEKDEETNEYGYWENPNAKWDWYQIGGRWSQLPLKETGKEAKPFTKLKFIDFSVDKEEYKKAERFWEIVVEGNEPKDGEKLPFDITERFGNVKGDELKPYSIYIREYYTKTFGNKETYARINALPHTHALITPDGKWHEKGSVGWFGTCDANNESITAYIDFFTQEVNKEENKDCVFVLVDCHI